MPGVPEAFWPTVFFVMGAVIGSFLNVVIWRLPRGQSVADPARSYCPVCKHSLSALDNIPLVSFLVLRARCRSCHAPISWRYFWVELLTALVFLSLARHFGQPVVAGAYCLFMAALIAAFFIDRELYIIPDELNTFAFLVGVALDLYLVATHAQALLWGWLPRSLLGAVVCAAVFVGIQLAGRALFGKDAMGDGDVKLARAIGAMLPLHLALVSFLVAIGAGAVLGIAEIAWQRARGASEAPNAADEAAEDEPEMAPSTLGEIVRYGALYLTFADMFIHLGALLGIPAAVRAMGEPEIVGEGDEDEFVAGPTHIPFGPYMVVGAYFALFIGDTMINWYMNWAHLGGH